ncbi:hypothetical protein JCM6882_005861 [Rhodosporidiobolus microsporus]
MLERLPLELLDLVLDHLGDPPTLYRENDERRRALYACCLVSRALRQRAQPQLWHRLQSARNEDVLMQIAGRGDDEVLRKDVRMAYADLDYHLSGDANLLLRYENVEEIGLRAPDPWQALLDPSLLQQLPNVTVEDGSDIFPPLSDSLLDQLDVVQGQSYIVDLIPQSILDSTTPFLYVANFDSDDKGVVLRELMQHPPRHLGVFEFDVDRMDDTLEELITLVQSPSRPVSLHLSTSIRSEALSITIPSLATAVVQACATHKVELLWHCVEGGPYSIWSGFWEYGKKVKAAARAEKVREGAGAKVV